MAEVVPEADGNANVPARRRSSAGVQLGRHSSSNARINEILENARERAESMAATSPTNLSPRPAGSPILPPNSSLKPSPVNEDSSADEATGFISHTPPLNYSSLNVSNAATSAPRIRKPSTRSLRQTPSSQRNSSGHGAVPSPEMSRQAEPHNTGTSWWQTQAEKFQSIELENKGSVARDHLAIERTFLAWLRTSLSCLSVGIGITQLSQLHESLRSRTDKDISTRKNYEALRHIGITFLGISVIVLLLGYQRYFQSQYWVIHGKFPASRGTIILTTFIAFAIIVAMLIISFL